MQALEDETWISEIFYLQVPNVCNKYLCHCDSVMFNWNLWRTLDLDKLLLCHAMMLLVVSPGYWKVLKWMRRPCESLFFFLNLCLSRMCLPVRWLMCFHGAWHVWSGFAFRCLVFSPFFKSECETVRRLRLTERWLWIICTCFPKQTAA